jgi:hypothetical protein
MNLLGSVLITVFISVSGSYLFFKQTQVEPEIKCIL